MCRLFVMYGVQEKRLPKAMESVTDRGGTLILVVGASGVGKDTLIDAARRSFKENSDVVFSKRVITRGDQAGEAHIAVDDATFLRMKDDGAFFLSWEAHGLYYGIPCAVEDDLAAGRSVVVNVSRRAVSSALGQWPYVKVLHIVVGTDILRERLLARGRESLQSIEARLRRAEAVTLPQDVSAIQVDNSGDLAGAVQRFTALIRALACHVE